MEIFEFQWVTLLWDSLRDFLTAFSEFVPRECIRPLGRTFENNPLRGMSNLLKGTHVSASWKTPHQKKSHVTWNSVGNPKTK